MTRTIDGRKYLMRDQRPMSVIRELYRAYCQKYGAVSMHRWLMERGKVHKEIKESK